MQTAANWMIGFAIWIGIILLLLIFTILITNLIPEPSESERWEAFRLGQKACLEHGITSVHDAGVDEATIELYRQARDRSELKVRLYVMLRGSDPKLLERYFSHKPEISPRLTVRTVKLVADGALGSRGAAMLEDYSDRPDWEGLMILSEEEIKAMKYYYYK